MQIRTARYVSGEELFKDCAKVREWFLDGQLVDLADTMDDLFDFDGMLLGSMTKLVAELADVMHPVHEHLGGTSVAEREPRRARCRRARPHRHRAQQLGHRRARPPLW